MYVGEQEMDQPAAFQKFPGLIRIRRLQDPEAGAGEDQTAHHAYKELILYQKNPRILV